MRGGVLLAIKVTVFALVRRMQTDIPFRVQSDFVPTGDQPTAIAELLQGMERGDRAQTLLGATGTGKTFTMSHVIAEAGRPR